MKEMKRCNECGVPFILGKDYSWDSGGVFAAKRDRNTRMVIYEPEVLNRAFRGIEELIGLPIDHIIIESRRRWNRRRQEERFPASMRNTYRFAMEYLTGDNLRGKTIGRLVTMSGKSFYIKIVAMGRGMGLGDITLGSRWEKREKYPHRETVIRNPYSLPLFLGDNLGATEGWEQRDMQNKYEEIGENTYRITSFEAEHPLELKGRLQARHYPIKPGDFTYEPCPHCGVPKDISRFKWDEAEGTLTDPDLGVRVVLTDPYSLEAVFEDLEAELGEEVQAAVIEGQREYTRSVATGSPDHLELPQLKKMLALRGLGNLRRFDTEERSLQATIENSTLHLLMVGLLQAAFEQAAGIDASTREWSLDDRGDLTISLRA